jgi:hypothetical protein
LWEINLGQIVGIHRHNLSCKQLRYFPKIYLYSIRNLQDTCPMGLSKDETGIVYPIPKSFRGKVNTAT